MGIVKIKKAKNRFNSGRNSGRGGKVYIIIDAVDGGPLSKAFRTKKELRECVLERALSNFNEAHGVIAVDEKVGKKLINAANSGDDGKFVTELDKLDEQGKIKEVDINEVV